MTLRFIGSETETRKLSRFLHGYRDAIHNTVNGLAVDLCTSVDIDTEVTALSIENKYYKATLVTQFTSQYSDLPRSEGIIIVLTNSDIDSFEELYTSTARDAHDNDLALRLLVSLHASEEDLSQSSREKFLNWSLDYGFEYIDIFEDSLLIDFDSRDKNGLPRVVEALESTMWSTMVKKASSNSTTTSKPAGIAVQQPVTESKAEEEGTSTIDIPPANSSTEYIPLTDGASSAAEEEDLRIFESFASAIAEARHIREVATTGNLSDEERRSRAAEMAMRMLQMMNLDDDDDDA